jgi:cyclic pyranopterin phosphate synthase
LIEELLLRLPVFDLPSSRFAGFESGPASISAVRVLRISVTDRCNYRCVYCMPEDGVPWLPRADLLGFEEIVQVVRAAAAVHGIRRFKLTGGEPTVRPGLVELVAVLREEDVADLSMTTNGQRLAQMAQPLRRAGLDRLTISIDSLNPAKFRRITRSGDLHAVLAGLDAAEAAGFDSIKINCVTMRGTNDDELADFARLTLSRKITVRFIEYMPLGDAALMGSGDLGQSHVGPAAGCDGQLRGDDVLIPQTQVQRIIERELGPLTPVDRESEPGVGPATVWRLRHGHPRGRIGFISAMSAPFCATCNRLRLTPDGLLRSCLFDGGEIDLKPILRAPGSGACLESLADAMAECVRLKPTVHSSRGNKQMSRIGG